MTNLPKPPSSLGDLIRWAREMTDCLLEREPIPSPNTLLTRTTRGFCRVPMAADDGGAGGSLQFKGQWAGGPYDAGDIVIRETNAELDQGDEAGTYEANDAVVTGDVPPGITDASDAALGVFISAGVITSINEIGGPARGYINGQVITIVGDGTGASAHITTNPDTTIATFVIDTGGTGYTSAAASLPTRTQKWVDFALGRWKKLTFRAGLQRIIVDVGRDSASDLRITIYKDYTDATAGSVEMNMADVLAIVTTGVNHVIKFRETSACDDSDFTLKHAIVLRSEYYP